MIHFPHFWGKKSSTVKHNFIRVSDTMPKFMKNLSSNSKKTSGRANRRTDRPYFIGSFWLPPGVHLRELENASRRDNLRFDRIAEYENELWVGTEDHVKDTLSETLGSKNTQIERTNRVGDKNKS